MGPDPPEAGASGSLPHSLRWWSTVLNPRVLLGVFLGMQLLMGLVGVPCGRSGLPCGLPAVLALLVSLPARLLRASGGSEPWRNLMVRGSAPAGARALLRGGLIKTLLQRRADGALLWGAIGLRGGLVGGWLALQAGLLTMLPIAPA